jgi:hypothetical protein
VENFSGNRIDSTLKVACTGKRSHDARVVDGVGAGEEATFAILEPLGKDLIAADLVGPEVRGNTIEVLGGVNVDTPAVGVVLDLADSAIALATESASGADR